MRTLLLGFDEANLAGIDLQPIYDLADAYQVVISRDKDHINSLRNDIEICVGNPATRQLLGSPHLRWSHVWSAGVDWLLEHPEFADSNTIITNASGVHPEPIGEHVFAMMLSLARSFPKMMRAQVKHEWAQPLRPNIVHEVLQVLEVYGSTVLILGMGAIGQELARLSKAFRMTVLATRRDASQAAPNVDELHPASELMQLLPRADIVISTVPLTANTRQMLDANAFTAMKSGAIFINIGRGQTVDESALISALESGHLAGAGLDVFEVEPLPEDSPLWDMDNVIITPHYAGTTPSYHARGMRIFADNLARYVQGQPLVNVVDKKRGY
jgi:D-2-hydroxyacid dehydrogenase (NADP+)